LNSVNFIRVPKNYFFKFEFGKTFELFECKFEALVTRQQTNKLTYDGWWFCITFVGYRYTWSKNDVISSVRKHNCALGLGLEFKVTAGVSVNTCGGVAQLVEAPG